MNSDDLREVLQFAYCMSYQEYLAVLIQEDTPYTREKYKIMQHDFSRWYCGLDSLNSGRFMGAFRPNQEKKLVESGAMCRECGSKEDVMYEKTSIVCGYCKGGV